MCPSETPDVIDAVLDNGVMLDADPEVGPNVITAEDEKVCFSHGSYLYNSFIMISFLP